MFVEAQMDRRQAEVRRKSASGVEGGAFEGRAEDEALVPRYDAAMGKRQRR